MVAGGPSPPGTWWDAGLHLIGSGSLFGGAAWLPQGLGDLWMSAGAWGVSCLSIPGPPRAPLAQYRWPTS